MSAVHAAARRAALYDLIRDDPSNIMMIADPEDAARRLLEVWDDHELCEIITAISNHANPPGVFRECIKLLEKDRERLPKLVRGIFNLDQELWENGTFDAQLFGGVIVQFWGLSSLLSECGAEFMKSYHPLLDSLPMDVYWRMRLTHFIKKKDWKRAYDDLRRAFSGFHDRHIDPGDVVIGYWAASKGFLARYITKLYRAMYANGLLPEPPSERMEYKSDKIDRPYTHVGGRTVFTGEYSQYSQPSAMLPHSQIFAY